MQGSCARENAPWLNRKIRKTLNSRPGQPERSRASHNNLERPGRSNPVSQLPKVNPAPPARFPASHNNPEFPGRSNPVSRGNPANPAQQARSLVSRNNPVNLANLEFLGLFLPAPNLPPQPASNRLFLPEPPASGLLPRVLLAHREFPAPSRSRPVPSPRLPPV